MDVGVTCRRLFQTLTRILETPKIPLLSNLTTLCIDGHDSGPDDWHQNWQAINAFAGLPSLRLIQAYNICINDDEDDSDYLLQPRSSNVSTLVLVRSSIGVKRLYQILQDFRALKTVSYKGTNRAQDPFETFWIRAALLAHVRTSLEYLNLERLDAGGKRYMGSLHDFENLKDVYTDLTFLVNAPHSSRRVLAQMLLASVEHVHLHEELYDNLERIQDLILTAANDKRELLPSLKQLHISLHPHEIIAQYETMVAGMKEACKDAGFELIID